MNHKPRELFLGANKPYLLKRHDCVWIIISGEVEIYYTYLDEEGRIKSPRNYLYTAKKGEMLFSLKTAPHTEGLTLMIVSADAKLIELRKEYLTYLNANLLVFKVEQWILQLGACLQNQPIPRLYEVLGETDTLKKGLASHDVRYQLQLHHQRDCAVIRI